MKNNFAILFQMSRHESQLTSHETMIRELKISILTNSFTLQTPQTLAQTSSKLNRNATSHDIIKNNISNFLQCNFFNFKRRYVCM